MFEQQLIAWMAWRQHSDWRDAKRVGFKPTGVEYRIMLEAGVAKLDGVTGHDWSFIKRIDAAFLSLRQSWPEHMIAIELYLLHNRSYRQGRIKMSISQVKYRRLVDDAKLMLLGAAYVIDM
jgi:hypothetical protein